MGGEQAEASRAGWGQPMRGQGPLGKLEGFFNTLFLSFFPQPSSGRENLLSQRVNIPRTCASPCGPQRQPAGKELD